jgi:hypothetical protein
MYGESGPKEPPDVMDGFFIHSIPNRVWRPVNARPFYAASGEWFAKENHSNHKPCGIKLDAV